VALASLSVVRLLTYDAGVIRGRAFAVPMQAQAWRVIGKGEDTWS